MIVQQHNDVRKESGKNQKRGPGGGRPRKQYKAIQPELRSRGGPGRKHMSLSIREGCDVGARGG